MALSFLLPTLAEYPRCLPLVSSLLTSWKDRTNTKMGFLFSLFL